MRHKKAKFISGLCGLAVLAGCASTEVAEKKAPATALECRVDIYENPTERSAVLATGGGLSFGASLAIALASGAMSHSIASNSEKTRLNDCYDDVQAAPASRLPLTATTRQYDAIIMAGGTPAQARRAVTEPARRGPGGGAGFGSL